MGKDIKGMFSDVKDKVKEVRAKAPLSSFKLDYMGGHPDITKQKSCDMDIFSDRIEMKVGRVNTMVMMENIQSINFETPQQMEKRVTATRLLAFGVFAFAFKKKVKQKFLTIDFTYNGLPNTMMFEGKKAQEVHSVLTNVYSSFMKNNPVLENNQASDSDNKLNKIKELKELLDMGAITEEEFEAKKKDLLGL